MLLATKTRNMYEWLCWKHVVKFGGMFGLILRKLNWLKLNLGLLLKYFTFSMPAVCTLFNVDLETKVNRMAIQSHTYTCVLKRDTNVSVNMTTAFFEDSLFLEAVTYNTFFIRKRETKCCQMIISPGFVCSSVTRWQMLPFVSLCSKKGKSSFRSSLRYHSHVCADV